MALFKRFTRLYTWTDGKNIGKVNLQSHIGAFDKAIGEVLPSYYDTFISVGKDNFVIDTAFPITPRQAREIGKRLAKTPAIGALCKQYKYVNGGKSKQIFKGIDISM